MKFKEFGNKDLPVIILIHGGGLSWWSWQKQIELLQKDYDVVTAIIEGHGEDWASDFISIQQSAKQVIKYIQETHHGKVFAVCGLSIGAQIIVEMISQEFDIAQNVIIESALVYPIKMVTALTVPMYNLCYGLIKNRRYAKLQAKTLNVPEHLFEQYFRDSSRMSKQSLINITKSNGSYAMPKTIVETTANVLIVVGEKEISVMKKSATLLHQTIKNSQLMVVKNAGHGELSLVTPEKYCELLQHFFNDVETKKCSN
ncbi:MAG: alpha/beta fold hydrolase [Turicibacter sp.]